MWATHLKNHDGDLTHADFQRWMVKMDGWVGWDDPLHGDPGNGDDLGSDFGQLTKSLRRWVFVVL